MKNDVIICMVSGSSGHECTLTDLLTIFARFYIATHLYEFICYFCLVQCTNKSTTTTNVVVAAAGEDSDDLDDLLGISEDVPPKPVDLPKSKAVDDFDFLMDSPKTPVATAPAAEGDVPSTVPAAPAPDTEVTATENDEFDMLMAEEPAPPAASSSNNDEDDGVDLLLQESADTHAVASEPDSLTPTKITEDLVTEFEAAPGEVLLTPQPDKTQHKTAVATPGTSEKNPQVGRNPHTLQPPAFPPFSFLNPSPPPQDFLKWLALDEEDQEPATPSQAPADRNSSARLLRSELMQPMLGASKMCSCTHSLTHSRTHATLSHALYVLPRHTHSPRSPWAHTLTHAQSL